MNLAGGRNLKPSEYFTRNFWVGASFLRSSESSLRYEVGVDRIMWGADYPHSEGTYPYTTERTYAMSPKTSQPTLESQPMPLSCSHTPT